MRGRFRRLLLSALTLIAWSGGVAAPAQESKQVQTNTVGNPQLRDFDLPGTRTTPAPTPPVTVTPPPPPQAADAPVASPPVQAEPAPRPAAPAATRPAVPRPPARDTAPASTTQRQGPNDNAAAPSLPQGPDVVESLPAPALPSAPAASAPAPKTAAPPAARQEQIPWLYFGLGAGAALLALFAVLKLRRRRAAEEGEEIAEPEAAAPQAAAAVPEPVRPAAPLAPAAPVPDRPAPTADIVGIQMRPWIELEFRPARAAATPTEANVQFDLVLRNTGNAAARNVRIEVRMFNAGPDQEREIELFYGEPIRERTEPTLAALPPRGEVQVSSAVAMPNDDVREVTIQGRRLFIPTVAFNVVYDWGNGRSGQTSTSYLVGREAEQPTAKMGAFRLDLGPRLYRSIGQRQTRLARIV